LGRADSHVNAQVRGLLVPLQALAARYRVALLAVTHLRKGDGIAIHRAMGSLAFVAAARASYAACKDKNDPTGRRRLLLPMKNNLGNDDDGFAYVLDTDCSPNGQPVVTWEPGLVRMTADEAMQPPKSDDDFSELDEAIAWLKASLLQGPRAAKEIFSQAAADGISRATLKRAKAKLQVSSDKNGVNGGWTWSLPRWHKQEREEEAQDEGDHNASP